MTAAVVPSDAAIRAKMEKLVPQVDLETITTKQFIVMLSNHMGGVDLSSRKKYIKATLTEVLDDMDNSDDDESESEDEKEPPPKKRRGGGLSAVKEISDDLATFLGKGKQMARTEVVKALWVYIKEQNLQNPQDKREIILDDKMKSLFHVDKFTMFTMNKYVGSHIHPFTPVDLNSLSANSKKKKEEKAQRRKAKKDAEKGIKKKRKRGKHAPWRLSPELSAIVGAEILPRPQVTSALWVYIKTNKLQNPDDGRKIICNDAMKKVMGGESEISMFMMNKFITPHMVEKLDKSAFDYGESDKSDTEEEEEETVQSAESDDESGTEEEDSD
jgi:upstream activation factor subunit UAF30